MNRWAWDRLGLAVVVLVAAVTRLPGLESRGQFDSDQGHDMLTLVAFTRDGVVPLLGPKTSVGEFHHGAFYYFLLAPAAAISNGDPVAVMALIALLGIAAVALTWWLARSIAGPLAGLVAGAILAVSPGAIEESTFIWNPNPIPFFAALALASAWRGHVTGRSRWWALAIGAAGAVAQLHVLGLVFLFAVIVLNIVELRTNRRAWPGLLGGLVVVAMLYLPLAIHELTTGFLETRLILDYFRSEGTQVADPAFSVIFTLLRIVGWPILGLVTDVPIGAGLALIAFLGLVGWYDLVARGPARTALRWLVGLLAFNTIALALVAPGLQRVVAGLPNDHYHAFLDPVVAVLFALSIAALLEAGLTAWRNRAAGQRTAPRLVAGVLGSAALVALLCAEVARIPPPDRNGGWAAARAAGERVVRVVGTEPVFLTGLPEFKPPDAMGFPIRHAGGQVGFLVDLNGYPEIGMATVVVCDRLFEGPIGLPCGGPAEDALVARLTTIGSGGAEPPPALVDRFDASPRTSISIYRPVGTP